MATRAWWRSQHGAKRNPGPGAATPAPDADRLAAFCKTGRVWQVSIYENKIRPFASNIFIGKNSSCLRHFGPAAMITSGTWQIVSFAMRLSVCPGTC
jgi:hypothetical protein